MRCSRTRRCRARRSSRPLSRTLRRGVAAKGRDTEIRELVQRIRDERGACVPNVDPDGPGIDAGVLIVLKTPNERGSLRTGLMATSNPDSTARNHRLMLEKGGLSDTVCVFWNAVPWNLGGREPRSEDLQLGAGYLRELRALLPDQLSVLACGVEAQRVCALAGLEAVPLCNPSNRGLNSGGRRREKWDEHVRAYRQAAANAKQ